MSGGENASYNDSHRAFLQAFMARGTLTYREAQPLLASILSVHEDRSVAAEDVTEEEFGSYISTVSQAVSEFDYEIRSTVHQKQRIRNRRNGGNDDGDQQQQDEEVEEQEQERIYVLVNSTSDNLTQLATTFSPDELAFIKRVLDEMFERNNSLRHEVCAVTGRAALQLHRVKEDASRRRTGNQPNTLTQSLNGNAAPQANDETSQQQQQTTPQGGAAQSITMTQAQSVLDALVAQGWFERSRKGYYSLTPRALTELRTWLVETYNDEDEDMMGDNNDDSAGGGSAGLRIKTCQACKDIVTVGQRCPKLSCPARLHDGCTKRFFRMQKAIQCPFCKTDWTGHGVVGEKAAYQGPRRSMNATASQSARRRTSGLDGVEDEEVGGGDEGEGEG